MKIIGVTGASGAGKTTFCSILKEKYGAYIVDADELARNLSKKGNPYLEAIVEYFGKEIVNEEGELKRKELASIIYQEEEKRKALNQITFTFVVKEIKEKIRSMHGEMIVIDAPLLFESKLEEMCDVVIGVIAGEKEKIERICKRDYITSEVAQKRLSIQVTTEEIKKKADYIIENNKDITSLEKELERILDYINQ